MPSGITVAASFACLSAGTWVDIVCLLIVIGMAYYDAVKGFTSTLAVLLGLLIATHAGYWLYPAFFKLLSYTSLMENHEILGAILPYILAVIAGVGIFILLRICFKRFFKLLVEQPADKFLGIISGIAKGLLIILIIFSCISLMPPNSAMHRVICDESITGRAAIPVLQTALSQSSPRDKYEAIKKDMSHKNNKKPSKNRKSDKK